MPHLLPLKDDSADWRKILQAATIELDELLLALELRPEDTGADHTASADFPLKVPQPFLRRMQRGDPRDPLLLQVLASRAEHDHVSGFTGDPVGETGAANPRSGIVHKYRGRVLLIVSSACAVHCRYCFRRHFPYADNSNSRAEWHAALDYVRSDSSISEVILSGGDPLVMGDAQLAELVAQVGAIKHVRRLRIHSRLPVVIPQRVTTALTDAISHRDLHTIMVIHANHANEIDASVGEAVALLRTARITSLNQAVLLAGVNDSLQAQVDLSETLFGAGVMPYYLHLLDKVAGAAHFDVTEPDALALHRAMADSLPGYLLPKLVREVEGATAKVNRGY